MTLRYWDPFTEIRRMEAALHRHRQGFAGPVTKGQTPRTWAAPVDVVREGEDVVVRVSLPGIGPDDIQVTLEKGVLTVRGETGEEREQEQGYLTRERRTGSFSRAIRLPDFVDTEKAETLYENGVLSITFPRLEMKVGSGGRVIPDKES
jgi:HSP20 family protein